MLLFICLIFTFSPSGCVCVGDLALVVYKFDGVPEHTVLVRPHGNC